MMQNIKLLSLVTIFLLGSIMPLMAQYEKGADMPGYKKVRIQSAMSYGRSDKGFLEFPGGEKYWKKKGNQMDIWTKDNNSNKLFYLRRNADGYFFIRPTTCNGNIDAKNVPAQNGTPLHLWDTHGKISQHFYFKHLGNGRYKIYHRSGKVVCLKDNKTDRNGNKVHLWNDHNAISTEWFILDAYTNKPIVVDKKVGIVSKSLKGSRIDESKTFYIQSAMSHGRGNKGYFEFGGADWQKKGNRAQIWTKGNSSSNNKMYKFEKTPNGEFYWIKAAKSANGVVDCKGGGTNKGTPLHFWSKHGGDSQKFYLKKLPNGSYKIYHKSDKVVCLQNNKTDNNGNKIHLWDDHNAITTEWYLIPVR